MGAIKGEGGIYTCIPLTMPWICEFAPLFKGWTYFWANDDVKANYNDGFLCE